MTRARAEKIIRFLKESGAPSPFGFPLDEGLTLWYCPPGSAEGSEWQSCKNNTFGLSVTMWPHSHRYSLYEGQTPHPNHIPNAARHHLWAQELYVYLKERSLALSHAIEELDRLFPIPRLDPNTVNDPAPYPEDFGIFATVKDMAAEAIENWLREVPNETTL